MPGYVGNQTAGCRATAGLCPDGRTSCDGNANCVERLPVGYVCECRVGWAGTGQMCGKDSDLDGIPDDKLPCTERQCQAVSMALCA